MYPGCIFTILEMILIAHVAGIETITNLASVCLQHKELLD